MLITADQRHFCGPARYLSNQRPCRNTLNKLTIDQLSSSFAFSLPERVVLLMESDDDDLQRAIRLSLLEDNGGHSAPQGVIDLTAEVELWPGFQDLDDMELYKGIALSMGKGVFLMTRC